MPEEPLRFRCYQCNQLLGVSPKKAGTVISCPRCKAELRVPGPEEPAASPEALEPRPATQRSSQAGGGSVKTSPAAESATLPSFMEDIAAAIPDDLASLRPEDIRVEAPFVDLVVAPTPPVPPSLEAAPVPELARLVDPSPPPDVQSSTTVSIVEPPPIAVPDAPGPDQALGTILPRINIETPPILPRSQDVRPVHEVVLQPATVLAWSLLVLLSLPMAFLAGLLIGHFVWR